MPVVYFNVLCIFNVHQQLITNEHVQDLVRNTLLEQDGNLGTQLKEAIFEPKMTRSKLKEVIEKGQVPVSMSLS